MEYRIYVTVSITIQRVCNREKFMGKVTVIDGIA